MLASVDNSFDGCMDFRGRVRHRSRPFRRHAAKRYAATKPEGDSSYAERLGELVSQYRSSGARGGWEWTVHSAPSRASIASPWRKQAA